MFYNGRFVSPQLIDATLVSAVSFFTSIICLLTQYTDIVNTVKINTSVQKGKGGKKSCRKVCL